MQHSHSLLQDLGDFPCHKIAACCRSSLDASRLLPIFNQSVHISTPDVSTNKKPSEPFSKWAPSGTHCSDCCSLWETGQVGEWRGGDSDTWNSWEQLGMSFFPPLCFTCRSTLSQIQLEICTKIGIQNNYMARFRHNWLTLHTNWLVSFAHSLDLSGKYIPHMEKMTIFNSYKKRKKAAHQHEAVRTSKTCDVEDNSPVCISCASPTGHKHTRYPTWKGSPGDSRSTAPPGQHGCAHLQRGWSKASSKPRAKCFIQEHGGL